MYFSSIPSELINGFKLNLITMVIKKLYLGVSCSVSDAFVFLSDAIVRNTGISEITDMTILEGPKIIKLFSCSTQLCMKFT